MNTTQSITLNLAVKYKLNGDTPAQLKANLEKVFGALSRPEDLTIVATVQADPAYCAVTLTRVTPFDLNADNLDLCAQLIEQGVQKEITRGQLYFMLPAATAEMWDFEVFVNK